MNTYLIIREEFDKLYERSSLNMYVYQKNVIKSLRENTKLFIAEKVYYTKKNNKMYIQFKDFLNAYEDLKKCRRRRPLEIKENRIITTWALVGWKERVHLPMLLYNSIYYKEEISKDLLQIVEIIIKYEENNNDNKVV